MAWRFQKRKKILPGVTLNLSKTGAGFRVGGKNMGASISTRGTQVTGSLPGTGLSASQKVSKARTPTWGEYIGATQKHSAPQKHPDFQSSARPSRRRRFAKILLAVIAFWLVAIALITFLIALF